MKGASEAKFRAGLVATGLDLLIYKPPDDARNWKPCDFMVWVGPNYVGARGSAWFEVKDSNAAETFSLKELRPSQRQGIYEAESHGIPYWLAIWWRRRWVWTITRTLPVLEQARKLEMESVTFPLLAGGHGIDARPPVLGSTLTAVLRGEL